jgi:hypothetical protein
LECCRIPFTKNGASASVKFTVDYTSKVVMMSAIKKLVLKCADDKKLAACLFLLFLLPFLLRFYAPTLSGEKAFHIADHTFYFEPFTRFIAEGFAAHRLPLWNPYLYCGMPQTAVPSPGIFYPPNLLFSYLPYSKALSLIIMFNQLVAALGGFLLVASFGWGITAATIAGITMSMCGYMFSLECNATLVFGAAWIPMMLWTFRRIRLDLAVGQRPYFASVIAALSTAMSIAAGRPEIFVPACVLAASMCLRDAWICHSHSKKFLPALIWQFSSLLVGALLVMPMLLPALEWVRLSPRANGLNLSQTFMWSVNWYDLVGLFLAYPFGDLQRIGAPHASLVATRPVFFPFVPSCYVGPIVWTCVIWGLCDKTWQNRRLISIYSICLVILCLGEYTPIAPAIMQAFPALTAFRFPIKWMVFLILALAIAAARGASNLVREKIEWQERRAALIFWGLTLLAATLFISLYMNNTPLSLAKPPLPVDAELLLGLSLLLASMCGFVACGLELLLGIDRVSAAKVAVLLPCLAAVNLLIPACNFQQILVTPKFFETKSFVKEYLDSAKDELSKQEQQQHVMNQSSQEQAKEKPSQQQAKEEPSQQQVKEELSQQRVKVESSQKNAKENLSEQSANSAGAGRFLSLYFDPLWVPLHYRTNFDGKFHALYDIHWTTAYFDYARNLLLPNTNLDKHVPETFGYEAAETGPYRTLFFDILRQCSVCLPGNRATDRTPDSQHYSDVPLLRFCQCTATGWLGTQATKGPDQIPLLDARYFTLMKEDKDKNVRLYHVKDPLPRAYLTRYWMWCDEQKPIMDKIRTADISKFNPTVLTMVERNTTSGIRDIKGTDRDFGPILAEAPARSPAIPPEIEHAAFNDRDPFIDTFPVSIMTDDPEHISMSVKPDRDCFLILTDHFYPGWQASIDGARRPCYRANAEGRAVYVPAGPHLVEFTFFPDSLALGFQLAAAGLIAIVVLIAAGLRARVWRFLKFLAGQK